MKTSILNLIRERGIVSIRDIMSLPNLQTKYREVCEQIAYLQMEGFVQYVPGKGYEAK